jgi:hypothetical protein
MEELCDQFYWLDLNAYDDSDDDIDEDKSIILKSTDDMYIDNNNE